MKRCPVCREEFETGAGLASHKRAKHSKWRGPNRKAIDQLIRDLDREVDAATAQMVRAIADALDLDPFNAQMWKTYREIVKELTEVSDVSDETEDELEAIRGTAQVGHLKAL